MIVLALLLLVAVLFTPAICIIGIYRHYSARHTRFRSPFHTGMFVLTHPPVKNQQERRDLVKQALRSKRDEYFDIL